MKNLVLIIHNVRSAHNVGSLLRSADGFGVKKVYITGYSPYPKHENDARLPHIAAKTSRAINKTALGAEESMDWQYIENIDEVLASLKKTSYEITVLEQTNKSKELSQYRPVKSVALIVGNEVDGIDSQTLQQADVHLEIPMKGKKESFNVAVAGSIAMYHFSLLDK
jgi:23S rRNA (guanosine2251-2'-O)-methyltransferase